MRASEDRYQCHRRRSDLAWRLIGHEARLRTICRWTGLSPSRIRTLYRNFGTGIPGDPIRRPRGKSPYSVDLLLRSPRQRSDAAVLAEACFAGGVLSVNKQSGPLTALPGIERGERLCRAFELFKRDMPDSKLTVEQAILLVMALARRQEIDVASCKACGHLTIIDRLAVRQERCMRCTPQKQAGSARASPSCELTR